MPAGASDSLYEWRYTMDAQLSCCTCLTPPINDATMLAPLRRDATLGWCRYDGHNFAAASDAADFSYMPGRPPNGLRL